MTNDREAIARKIAEEVLMSRLVEAYKQSGFGKGRRLEVLKERIARIRAGNGDTLPEVQSAMLALTRTASEPSEAMIDAGAKAMVAANLEDWDKLNAGDQGYWRSMARARFEGAASASSTPDS